MAIRLESDAEVLPGYRLLERLGSGGFGEVWKAEAPGGLHKAIKILHDQLDPGAGSGTHRAEQELNALKRVQAVRHPYLLSIERYDIVDGRLVIVTELADCNLWDRFLEFRHKRQAGIPRDDLLRYMQEAAEVLDLMNDKFQLQHLDIKPQNLFLVHDHIKVADFGLVTDVSSGISDHEGAATPVYAAPETFEGHPSPFCDQYSLAIVYQELLTGKRPFPATNIQQLITQHLQGAPDLGALPPSDRTAVAKALSKQPENRHASCLAFVRALQAGGAAAPAENVAPARSAALVPEILSQPVNWNETPPTNILFRQEMDTPGGEMLTPFPAPPEETGEGTLFPALIIGVGEMGLEVLQRARQALIDRFGSLKRLPNIRFLFIDTDPETTENALSSKYYTSLEPDEVLSVRLNRPGHYLKPRRNGRSIIEGWFDQQLLYRIKPGNPLTQGIRALGRLAFCDHYRALEQKLRGDLEACTNTDALEQADLQTQLGMRSNRPRIFLVAGMGGGTGSGMFLDIAYAVRHRLKQMGYESPDVTGLLLLPPWSGPGCRPLAMGNAFAALTELNHFSVPGVPYTACIDDKELTLLDHSQPFTRFSLVPIRSPHDKTTEPVGAETAAEYLWRNLVTPFGRSADDCREQVRSLPGVTPDPSIIAGNTFGLFALSWPRRLLVQEAARRICCQMLDKWTSPNGRLLQDTVREWVNRQWQEQQCSAEFLLASFQQVCEQSLGQKPDSYFSAIADVFVPKNRWSRSTYDPAAVWQTLGQIGQLVGMHHELNSSRQSGQFDGLVQAAGDAIGKDWETKLIHLAVCLIEQPDFRLAGAEETIRALQEMLNQVLAPLEPQCDRQGNLANEAYERLEQILAADVRRKQSADVADLLRAYALYRFQWLLLKHLVRVFTHLRDRIGDAQKDVDYCRQRLAHVRQKLEPASELPAPSGCLLPDGCQTIEDAVQLCLQVVPAEELQALDRQTQTMIEQQFTALIHVCLTSSDLTMNLQQAMQNLVQRHVAARLGEVDVAQLFLSRYSDPERAARKVSKAFNQAEPTLEAADAPVDSVQMVALPSGATSEPFQKLVEYSLSNFMPYFTFSPDDIIFYREQVTVPLRCLPHLGSAARSAYVQMLQQQMPPHSRSDIQQWYEVQ
jgi:serine/threonine protein kinase